MQNWLDLIKNMPNQPKKKKQQQQQKTKKPFFLKFPHNNLMFWSPGPEDKLHGFNPKFWSLLALWSWKIT